MNPDDITMRVKSIYPEAVVDLSGADCSFEMYVISHAFESMNTLERQKSILALFNEELSTGKLHALSIKARTPEEQNQQSGLVQLSL